MNNPTLNLPNALLPFEAKIKDSVKPFVRITAQPDNTLTIVQSKFGGKPYWPAKQDYPKDERGNPLVLLAQINWAEVPALDGFPAKGLLQFYVADDEIYGLNLDDLLDQSNFRVIYYQDFNEDDATEDFSFLKEAKNFPIAKPHSLIFEKQEAPVAPEDMAFEQIFEKSPYEFFEQFDKEVKEEYIKLAPPHGHKIGGYAHFTQEDPRFWDEAYENYQLLLQIDSQDESIRWGDRGIGNFFIKPEDLQALDFSKVLYHWDNP